MKLVLDASIIIKWFKPFEQQYEEAKTILDEIKGGKIEPLISTLTIYEIFNHFSRDKNIEFAPIYEYLQNINLQEIHLVEPISSEAFYLAQKHSISFYDASYIALADHLNCDFITADKKLVKKVNLTFVKEL